MGENLAKLTILLSLTVLPASVGYATRRLGLASEELGRRLMTFVLVFGASSVGFLSIWSVRIEARQIWLPALAAVHVVTLVVVGLLLGRLLLRDRAERGLFGLACGMGNTGHTMGGFVVFLLYGVDGLALSSIYGLMWMPVIVLLVYPIARHFAMHEPPESLGTLMLRCLLHWRSLPLPMAATAIVLSICRVPRPRIVAEWYILNVLVYTMTSLAYFSIGLRLHLTSVGYLKKQILCLLAMRFVVAAALALLLLGLTRLTPWPLMGLARDVFIILSFCPVAVTVVGVANMFTLKARHASVLFVATTATYLIVVLPLVLWLFGG